MEKSNKITWLVVFHLFSFMKQGQYGTHSITGWKLSHFSGHCKVTHLLVAILPHTRVHWNFEKNLLVQLYSISKEEERCTLVQHGSFVDEGVRQNQESILNSESYLCSHITEYFPVFSQAFLFLHGIEASYRGNKGLLSSVLSSGSRYMHSLCFNFNYKIVKLFHQTAENSVLSQWSVLQPSQGAGSSQVPFPALQFTCLQNGQISL